MNKAIVSAFFLALIVCVHIQAQTINRKQLQGPPSEFSEFVIPSPSDVAQRSESALTPVFLTQNGDVWSWADSFNVDSSEEFSLAILSPHKESLQVYLQPPNQNTFTLLTDSMFTGQGSLGIKTSGPFGIDGANADSTTYTFFEPTDGLWQIKITSTTALPIIKSQAQAYRFHSSATQPQAYILVSNPSNIKIFSHLSSYILEEGQQVGVVVTVYDESQNSDKSIPTPLQNVVSEAVLAVVLPSGQQIDLPMHDDGLHSDGAANDGVYAATLTASNSGDYLARVEISGKTEEGVSFYRTSQHIIAVSTVVATLKNSAVASFVQESKMVSFNISVSAAPNAEVLAYAELHETSAMAPNKDLPVAWMSGITQVQTDKASGKQYITLQVNQKWIEIVGINSGSFSLQNVMLQDKDSFSILSTASLIPVTIADQKLSSFIASRPQNVSIVPSFAITEEMRYGPRPASFKQIRSSSQNETESTGKLLLVHGYCSGPVWDVNDFSNAVVFTDYSQSRSNDEFARMILEFGLPYNSYGIVAHSQGGLASLHLKTYYWSGLDALTKGRAIQTVGSPYRGCSLAGALADLGWLFGFGCGSNFDLSRDGASLWYSKIPKFVGGPQSSVYYYTTRYTNNWWFFSNCVTASNLILSKPNDGTCELKYAMLDNGNGQPTVEGWCHASNMKYPPQTSDPARNKEMSMYAGR